MERNIILLIGLPNGIARNRYEKMIESVDNSFEFFVLHSRSDENVSDLHRDFFHYIEQCDFSDPDSIKSALAPYADRLCAVTARSDVSVPLLLKALPFLPKHLHVSSKESLEASLDKSKMRERFFAFNSSITPKWKVFSSYSEEGVEDVIAELQFPLIVKPTGLAASSFVSKVMNAEELRSSLRHVFEGVSHSYNEKGRQDDVCVVVEEFMEGDVYSVDVYVSSKGVCTFTPFVEYRNRSVDDFSPYIRITPSNLSKEEEEEACCVAEKGIKALGLTSTSTHVELMKTRKGWKVVEIGPRVGGNRDKLYTYAYGFNHAQNDIFTRMDDRELCVTTETASHSVVIFLYPEKEGSIVGVKGLDEVRSLDSFKTLWMTQGPGDYFKFSKNGGKHVVKVTLVHEDKEVLEKDLERVQRCVDIDIR